MTVKMKGDKELSATLRRVGYETQMREIDNICRGSLEPLRDRVQSTAPRPSLRRGVVIAKIKSLGAGKREFWVSFTGMARMIAHLVEFGTQYHSLYRGASVRKNLFQDRGPYHPGQKSEAFFRPAYEGTKDDVLTRFGQLVMSSIISTTGGRQ